MKKLLVLPTMILPYMLVLIFFSGFIELYDELAHQYIVLGVAMLLLLASAIVMNIVFIVRKKQMSATELVSLAFIIKCVHIPTYVVIFIIGFLMGLMFFMTFPLILLLVFIDLVTLWLGNMISVYALIAAFRERIRGINTWLIIALICQAFFCADIISLMVVNILLQKRKRTMERVLVIGCPGSGKSTFSRELSSRKGLPLYHLDMMFWNADRTTVSQEVFDARLDEVLPRNEWIIDGNFGRTLEKRIRQCDTVFFLDYPTEVCLEGVRSRIGKPRPDMPWAETEEDPEFMAYIAAFNDTHRPQITALLDKYYYKRIVVFNSRAQADTYLSEVAK